MCDVVALEYGYEEWKAREERRFGGLVQESRGPMVENLIAGLLDAGLVWCYLRRYRPLVEDVLYSGHDVREG